MLGNIEDEGGDWQECRKAVLGDRENISHASVGDRPNSPQGSGGEAATGEAACGGLVDGQKPLSVGEAAW